MKTNAKQFLKQLAMALKVVDKNSTLPILSCVVLDENGIHATNLDVYMTVPLVCDFAAVVEGHRLYRVVKTLTKTENIEIVKSGDNSITVIYGKTKVKLYCSEKVEHFPQPHDGPISQIATDVDATALGTALKFTGNDELRPVMSGVWLSDEICATNAHYLYKDVKHKHLEEVDKGVIIPRTAVRVIAGNYFIDIERMGEMYARTELPGGIVVTWRTIDGRYPNYKAVWPNTHLVQAWIDAASLRAAVECALVASDPSTHQGRFEFKKVTGKDWSLDLRSESDSESEFRTWIPVTADKPGIDQVTIGVNLKFLKMVLGCVKTERVCVSMNEPNKAITINDKFLLMPIMLND